MLVGRVFPMLAATLPDLAFQCGLTSRPVTLSLWEAFMSQLSRTNPIRPSRRLMISGVLMLAASIVGVLVGLTYRPARDLGAVCIFTAVGGAMLLRRGIYGSRGPSDGGDSDGWSSADGDSDSGGDGGGSE